MRRECSTTLVAQLRLSQSCSCHMNHVWFSFMCDFDCGRQIWIQAVVDLRQARRQGFRSRQHHKAPQGEHESPSLMHSPNSTHKVPYSGVQTQPAMDASVHDQKPQGRTKKLEIFALKVGKVSETMTVHKHPTKLEENAGLDHRHRCVHGCELNHQDGQQCFLQIS